MNSAQRQVERADQREMSAFVGSSGACRTLVDGPRLAASTPCRRRVDAVSTPDRRREMPLVPVRATGYLDRHSNRFDDKEQ
jgi:hypothetical protein